MKTYLLVSRVMNSSIVLFSSAYWTQFLQILLYFLRFAILSYQIIITVGLQISMLFIIVAYNWRFIAELALRLLTKF